MPVTQERVKFMNPINSPIMEHPQEGHDHLNYDYEEEETTFSGNGCDCFGLFSKPRGRNDNNEEKILLNQKGEDRENWLSDKLKKMKEFSELLAGPKWKTFIRKLTKKRKNNQFQFQYDPESYALNFDSGLDGEEDGLARSFSTRFGSSLSDERGRL